MIEAYFSGHSPKTNSGSDLSYHATSPEVLLDWYLYDLRRHAETDVPSIDAVLSAVKTDWKKSLRQALLRLDSCSEL